MPDLEEASHIKGGLGRIHELAELERIKDHRGITSEVLIVHRLNKSHLVDSIVSTLN